MIVPKEPLANAAARKRVLEACAKSAAMRRQVTERCSNDGLFWLNMFGTTIDPRRTPAKLPFVTYPFQDDLFRELEEACNEGRDLRIEKSRDMGVSWVTCAWMTWRAMFRPNQMFLMLSRKETLVDGDRDSLFAHCDVLTKGMPEWLKPKNRRSKLTMDFPGTESVIEGESTNADAGRGGRRTAILWDEAAACPGGGDDIAAATQANTNCRILNSTPKGESNYFAASRKTTRTFRAHWSLHPEKRIGLYKPTERGIEILEPGAPEGYVFREQKPSCPEGVRSPWYDRQCDRTPNPVEIAAELDIDYQGSDYPFFDSVGIDAHIATHCRPALYRGRLRDDGDVVRFEEDNRGPLSVWLDMGRDYVPPSHRNFVVACDIGQGTGASDSVASVVDRDSGEKVAEWVHNKTGVEAFARTAVNLCQFFARGNEPAFMIWDGGGPGLTFGKVVTQDLGFRRVYMKRDDTKVDARWTPKDRKTGWFSNRDLKRDLLIQYREALANGKFFNPSEKALLECKQFKNMADGSVEHVSIAQAQDGGDNHGDRVIADALANFIARPNVIANERRQPTVMDDFPFGSFGWRQRRAMDSDGDKFSSKW